MKPGMIKTADTKPAAEELRTEWAAEVYTVGLAPWFGVNIRTVRLPRGLCWGVFIEPHDSQADPAELLEMALESLGVAS